MTVISPEWHEPRSLDEVLSLRAEHGDEATIIAGGSFLGIIMNQGFFAPTRLVALRNVPELDYIEADDNVLRLGAMTTHRAVERSDVVKDGWPTLAFNFFRRRQPAREKPGDGRRGRRRRGLRFGPSLDARGPPRAGRRAQHEGGA
jgi:hypothetical protein